MLAVARVWVAINPLLVGLFVGVVLENASFGVGAVIQFVLVLLAFLVPRVGARSARGGRGGHAAGQRGRTRKHRCTSRVHRSQHKGRRVRHVNHRGSGRVAPRWQGSRIPLWSRLIPAASLA
jgi:hypothetical protein